MASFLSRSREILTGRKSKPEKKPINSETNFSGASSNPKPVSPYNQCSEHDGELEEIFCVGHASMLCVVCRRMYHSKCQRVVPITDACVGFSATQSTEICEKQVRQLIAQCYAVARERHWDMNDLDSKKNDVYESVMYVKRQLYERIDKLVNRATEDLERLYNMEKTEMENHMTSLKEMVASLEEKIAKIGVTKKEELDLNLFIAVQNAMDKHKRVTSALGQIHDEAHKVFLKFQTSVEVDAAMETLKSVGDITLSMMEYNVIPRPKQAEKPALVAPKSEEPEEFKIRKHVNDRRASITGEICVRDKEDLETCWITGMVILKDSTLIVADNNNSRIKLIGPNHQILNSFHLSTPPFDIALLNQREAVFTLPDMKEVQFVRIIGKSDVKYSKNIKLEFDCNGVAAFSDKLILTSIAEKCVRTINHEGEIIWTVVTDDLGDRLFEWPWYVETNEQDNKIYVSDRRKNTITTLDVNGNLLNVRDVRGKGPRGTTLDDVENMYICHYMTDEVEIVSTDHTRDRRTLLSKLDGIKHPQSLCYDTEKGQLLLSANNSDFISIIQIS